MNNFGATPPPAGRFPPGQHPVPGQQSRPGHNGTASLLAALGTGVTLILAVLVGVLVSVPAALALVCLAALYGALLMTGMPLFAGADATEMHLRTLLRCPPPQPLPPPGQLTGSRPITQARRRLKLNRRVWLVAASTTVIACLAIILIWVTIDEYPQTSSLVAALFVALVVVVPVVSSAMVATALAEVDGRFPSAVDWARALNAKVYATSLIALGIPLLVGYVTYDLALQILGSKIYLFDGAAIVAVWLPVFVAATLTAATLRWAPYFAAQQGLPIRGCLVESIRLARIDSGQQIGMVAAIWVVPTLIAPLGIFMFYTGFDVVGLPLGVVAIGIALTVDALAGAEQFRLITGPPTTPVEAVAADPRAMAWQLPRRSILATIALISYPLANGWAYAKITASGNPFGTTNISDLVLALVLTLVPIILATIAVMAGKQSNSVAPGGVVGLLGLGGIAASIGGAVVLAIQGQTSAADAGAVAFATDFVAATTLLAGWILGHRSRPLSALVAPIGGLIVASVISNLNDTLSHQGVSSSDLESGNFESVAQSFAVVSAVFIATAWAAYAIELLLRRIKPTGTGPTGPPTHPGNQPWPQPDPTERTAVIPRPVIPGPVIPNPAERTAAIPRPVIPGPGTPTNPRAPQQFPRPPHTPGGYPHHGGPGPAR